MYTREEASQIRSEFWTRFGQYMRPIPGADGKKKNWLNYKTGVRDIFFRLNADKVEARVSIEVRHAEAASRENVFAKFKAFRPVLEDFTKEKWNWETALQDENGKDFARISHSLRDVNLFDREDWASINSFLKPRIIALDGFWNLARENFE